MLIRLENMKLLSVANKSEHWATKKRRNKSQTYELHCLYGQEIGKLELPATVTMTRVGRQILDGDNLRMAFKHIRDYLATQMLPEATQANQHGRRGDDSDPRITWQYGQRMGPYAVEIFIEGDRRL